MTLLWLLAEPYLWAVASMLVVVVVVGGVAVPVVHVVDMVAVRERLMPAAGPVSVFVVAGMSQVRQRVLVVMALMGGVGMAFVDVVGMALALHAGVPAS
jgi:hypothetical protein